MKKVKYGKYYKKTRKKIHFKEIYSSLFQVDLKKIDTYNYYDDFKDDIEFIFIMNHLQSPGRDYTEHMFLYRGHILLWEQKEKIFSKEEDHVKENFEYGIGSDHGIWFDRLWQWQSGR